MLSKVITLFASVNSASFYSLFDDFASILRNKKTTEIKKREN